MLDIGIRVEKDLARARTTVESLHRLGAQGRIFLLLEPGVAAEEREVGEAVSVFRTSRAGGATALNALLETSSAPRVALLEGGVQIAAGTLERLAATLQGPIALAGPSTNFSWNEQGQRDAPPVDDARLIARYAKILASRHRSATRELRPLHSLGDFCLAVRREPMLAIGGADDAYDPGPCWEMDLQVRAHRAGWKGIWLPSAYAHRAPITELCRSRSAEFFLANRRRFQDRFCGQLIRGTKFQHNPHCRGDACPDFAPPELLRSISRGQSLVRPSRAAVSSLPLVSCILPTRSRPGFAAEAIRGFLRQDYPHTELVVVDDGPEPIRALLPVDERIRYFHLPGQQTTGAKRNIACENARGEIIAHVDDDDWYPSDRLSRQVRALLHSDAAVCGTSRLYFFDALKEKAWLYTYALDRWLAGTSLVYRRSYWEDHRFRPIQVGEDWYFVRATRAPRTLLNLDDPELALAAIHARNTSPKPATGSYWREIGYDLVRSRLDSRAGAYRAAAAGSGPEFPLVSCIMPTRNRPEFAALAIEKFRAQDYPHKELIVLDDGAVPVSGWADADPSVRYVHMNREDRAHVTVGEKRAIACRMAKGEIISVWDDDDWYTPERLRCQVLPIVYGEADMTGLRCDHLLCFPSGEVWQVNDEVHRCMFESDVAGGTITFRREVLDYAHFPPIELAEDAALIRMARARGWRLKRIANHGVFAYVRHPGNTWRFEPGQFYDPGGWRRAELPPRFSPLMLDAHREAFRLSQDRHAHSGAAF